VGQLAAGGQIGEGELHVVVCPGDVGLAGPMAPA